MARDIIGNELKLGDFICISDILKMLNQAYVGKITGLSNGDILPSNAPKGARVAGSCRVFLEFAFPFDPLQPINVVKVATPEKDPNSN